MKKTLLIATAILALVAINACSFEPSPCEKKIANILELINESKTLRAEAEKIHSEDAARQPKTAEELDSLVRSGEVSNVLKNLKVGTARLNVITDKINANVAKLSSEHPVESFAQAGCTQEQVSNLGRILTGIKLTSLTIKPFNLPTTFNLIK